MASPPTSARLRLLDLAGQPLAGPIEWTPAVIEVLVAPEAWDRVRVTLQDQPQAVSLRKLDGTARVVVDWPRSGPGRYRLGLDVDGAQEELLLTVHPRKISTAAYVQLLEDLEARLPAVVALGLQRTGGLAGVALPPPGQTTLAQELARLRRALLGTPGRPGLAAVLTELARDPHRVLRTEELWVRAERARRPPPARLHQALARGHNLDADHRPTQVVDARVDPTTDVYENRLVLAFTYQVALRLRRLVQILEASPGGALDDARALLAMLRVARRRASFLDEVALPAFLPTRTTMVLLRRPPYRAALEGYLEFNRSVAVRLEAPGLEAPLENLPALYQTWGTLEVIAALLDVAVELGYRVISQRLTVRDAGRLYIRVLPDGVEAVVLAHPGSGTEVRLVPERSYRKTGVLRSISFEQRPDVAVEVRRPGSSPRLYLFDPKYKLDGEVLEGETGDGRPKKVDVDKMHAYRDAIRDEALHRVVHYAAILYPGPEVRYADGIEALPARPGEAGPIEQRLRDVLRVALGDEV